MNTLTRFLILVLLIAPSCSEKPAAEKPMEAILFPVKENSKYGYMDKTGKVVVAPSFDHAFNFQEGMGRIKLNGRYGFVNAKGEVQIKPEFAFADDFKDGYARVNTSDVIVDENDYTGYSLDAGWTFVDKKGAVFSETFAKAEYIRDGYAQVKHDPSYDSPWSYATLSDGNLIPEERITEAIFNYNGHDTAPASDLETRKIGTINKREEWVIPASFDQIETFSEGRAAAKKGNVFGYINRDGNWVYQRVTSVNDNYYLASDFKPFSNGLAAVKLGENAYTYIKTDGTTAFPQKFKTASSFNEAGYAIVSTESGTGLIDKQGRFVIKPHLDIVSVTGDIAIFRSNNSFGAKDLKTLKEIVPPQYDNVEVTGNLIKVTQKGATFGFTDKKGEFVIAPQYDFAWEFKNGKAIVQQKEKFLYVDRTGKVLGNVPPEYQPYYYADAGNLFASQDGDKVGYMRAGSEAFVIPPVYDFATDFEGKIARVNMGAALNEDTWLYEGGKWGLIDEKGTTLLAPKFELITPFRKTVALFNEGGEATYTPCPAECEEAVYYACLGGKWGLVNSAGKIITEAVYEMLIPFGKNYLASKDELFSIIAPDGSEVYPATLDVDVEVVEQGDLIDYGSYKILKASENGKTGVLSNTGKWIVTPQYDDVLFASPDSDSPFSEGLLLISSADAWGVIDEKGNVVIEPSYEEIRPFKNKYAAVMQGGQWGFIDRNNSIVVPPAFYNVRDFQGGVAIVQESPEAPEGVINSLGEWIIKPQPGVTFHYDGFVGGLCVINGSEENTSVGYPLSTAGVVNDKGKVLFHARALSDARINEGGLIYAIKNDKWAVADSEGVMLSGFVYSWIEPYHGQELIRCNTGGEIVYGDMAVQEEAYGGRWGFIDKSGKVRVPMKFSELGEMRDGLAAARTSEDLDEIGYYDFNGMVVRPLKK